MSDMVIREVTKGVWTFSCPFARFGIMPIGGRTTAIQMKAGGVWVLASTPLTDETKSTIDALGKVKFIVGPDAVHYLFLPQFKKAYPDAKLIAVADVANKLSDKSLRFDGLWGQDPADTKYGFEDEIKHCYFSGHSNKDVAFLHTASKTLIQADLLFNLPAREQYSKSSLSIPFNFSPSSWLHQKLVSFIALDKGAMKRDATTVASWDFNRIIPCHGDVIETDGNKAWREAYKHFID
ncbi:hypothetical protein SERLA73DRAFT_174974 [Serpula lacrymans var. lacrymans S7.3]|uniref:DUF4336 domain-containing protein n=2 Tax=Serpula lacrymans var. lacrymans TaxID=341189 RepID=F8PJR9_SERL3|nr:uncharacterized protein SERLADRAFT_359387 [Serpula lacrymans var. lacrymans S7.9]EGO03479.1 hypothetical protein SERLA73DRAFT_174974 [Serpula lacrymans var. lacrymans S7.3]EGO29236.1 hypothetical protein SERLADRAFT_359387 [Serpula lacrymans var. lacrymans S7.9]